MTELKFGDVVRCSWDEDTQIGPLKEGGLYVIEAVAKHGKSVRVAGDWHKISRFTKVGTSTIVDEEAELKKQMSPVVERIDDASRALLAAFVWKNSLEGDEYWREVSTKLDGYARRFRSNGN